MQINQHNYEAFFLDFWENTLQVEAREELALFLQVNPDLHDEFLDFKGSVSVCLDSQAKLEFPLKAILKKPEIIATSNFNENNFEDVMIASLEGDLSNDESEEFKDFISKNPQLVIDLELYKKTFLIADQQVLFNNKQGLKRKVIPLVLQRFYIYGSVAAAVLLLALVLFLPFNSIDFRDGASSISQLSPLPEKPLPVMDAKEGVLLPEILQENSQERITQDEKPQTQPDIPTGFSIPVNHMIAQNAPVENTNRDKNSLAQLHRLYPLGDSPIYASPITEALRVDPRTEISEVFNDMILRDERSFENLEPIDKNAFGRVIANLRNQLFGSEDQSDNQTSLFGQVAELGKERISELKEDAPKFETIEQDGKTEKYFTVNENFSIRISKKDKAIQANE